MRLRYFFLAILFSTAFIAGPSVAALDLELTQGMNAAIPVAVAPFEGPAVEAPGNQTIPEIIKNDLQNSGQFRVVGPDGLGQNPGNIHQINFAYWRREGVNAVVVGVIQSLPNRQYQIAFTLVNVYHGSGQTENDSVLLSQSFQVNAAGLRNVAHHISDLIYQKLTGARGVFSTKIAYVVVQRPTGGQAKYSLVVSDADGFDPRPLLASDQPIMSPTWSPNGQQIAYVSFEGHHAAIYLQNVASGQRRMISDAPGINGAPAFSPDGRELALVLSKTGNPNIYLLNLASGQLRPITHDWSIDTEPAFSPDGKSLLFTSNRDGTPQIYHYSLLTSQVSRVTYSGDYNARASFLPGDHQSIIMMHRENGLFGIARQDLASGQIDILAQSGVDESPSLAPNGRMIIYATEYGQRGVLAQVSTDGRIKLRLPGSDGVVQEPAWSPFLTN